MIISRYVRPIFRPFLLMTGPLNVVSGFDPEISRGATEYQAARHLPLEKVHTIIAAHTDVPLLVILVESQVNLLEFHLAHDALR
jgi:K+-transporting ATPase c subunit